MKPLKIKSKICIIGAGPSGAALSIFLSKEKVEHIIIDAALFPRDKICGDGLDLKAIKMLNHIDKKILQDELKKDGRINASWGFRLINQNGKYSNFIYTPKIGAEEKPPYAVSKRFSLDNILVEKIDSNYSTFYQNTKAKSICRINNTWKINAVQNEDEIEIECNLLVGADGDRSIVLKNIGERKIDKNHYAAGVRQYWQGIDGIHEKKIMEIYYPKSKPMSYLWIFPLENGLANVGYGMLSSIVSKYNYNITEIFKDLLENDLVLKERFKNATPLDKINGWGIPLASLKRKCSGDGWLLLGDAASMVSPTTGEGIGTGMTTSFIASKFIKKAIDENNFNEEIFKNYDREIYRRMLDDIKLFKISMKISPKLFSWIMNNIIPLNYFKKLFQKKVEGWIYSAYNEELNVKLN